MTDIFLSYSSKDRELVRPLVEVLESRGCSVWWDQEIPSGTNFGKVIEMHLHTARCAIVAWTRNSVESDWVRNEASEAHSRGALIPIVLEKGVKFPLEFRQVQTLDLSDWQPGTKHPQFDRLFQDLQTRLSVPAADAANSSTADTQPMQPPPTVIRRRLWQTATSSWWYVLSLLALPALFVGVVAWALMQWKMPSTSVELDLTVKRIRVAFAADGPVPIIKDALAFRSLAVRNFARIELEPKCWSGIAADTVKCVEWRTENGKEMVITARARKAATLLIERSATDPTSANGIGQLQPFAVAADASASFESDPRQPPLLSFKIDNRAPLVQNLLPTGLLRLTVSDAEVSGISGAYEARDENFAFDVRTGNPSEVVSITGGDRSFMLRIERVSPERLVLLGDNGAPIQAIDVGRMAEGEQGEEVSALVETGELRYRNLPEDTKIALTPQTLLKLTELKNFRLTELNYDGVKGAYVVQARGEAKRLATFIGNARTDRRLSWFDRLWHDTKLRVLFAIVTFVLGATPGLINLLSAARHQP